MSDFIKIIKNLFAGVLSFLVGLLRGKKSEGKLPDSKPAELPGKVTGKTKRRSGYFLELDENDSVKPVETKQPAASNGSKTPAPVSATQPAKAESAKTPATVAGAKPTQQEPDKTPEPAVVKPAEIELVQTAKGVKVEPSEPAKSKAASANGQQQTESTFAPKYLNPSTNTSNGRRRPGPSMNNFLDMARQVKTSS